MLYAALIWRKWDTDEDFDPTDPERYQEFNAAVDAADIRRGGVGLQPVDVATTVRLRDDEVLMTDGPFLETKEHLSGFYLLECADLDEAIAWAAKIPTARQGAIEVRPVIPGHE